jgi:hypothetical protein
MCSADSDTIVKSGRARLAEHGTLMLVDFYLYINKVITIVKKTMP